MKILDARTLGLEYPRIEEPASPILDREMLVAPIPREQACEVALVSVSGHDLARQMAFETPLVALALRRHRCASLSRLVFAAADDDVHL